MERNISLYAVKSFRKILNLQPYVVKNTKNGFKKISDELMFKNSNLGFLTIFKEFKSLLSSNIP